ncbi:MAG: hypothetical protein R6X25_10580 [Candidatus Krumholzibacteriia bacterium]
MSSRHTTAGAVAAGLAVAAAFTAVWLALHPPPPLLPTADVYSHLSVARHLVAGDGFVTDVTYPLSFAFPFARRLPQPLIHRPPGYALLLAVPVAAARGDPGASLSGLRALHAVLLAALVWLGINAAWRSGRAWSALPWLVLVAATPLLAFSVGWGEVEVPAALLLMGLWLGRRPAAAAGDRGAGLLYGLGAGFLTLLRVDLVWVPVLWWAATAIRPAAPRGAGPPPAMARPAGSYPAAPRRATTPRIVSAAIAAVVWLVVVAPWAIRNAAVTGDPFFALQTHAEHLKDTRAFPGYTIYRGLEPESLATSLQERPEILARIQEPGRNIKSGC